MIISFRDKETEKIWKQQYSRQLPEDIQRIVLRKLIIINRAKDLNDLEIPPGNKLEQLIGDRHSSSNTTTILLNIFIYLFPLL